MDNIIIKIRKRKIKLLLCFLLTLIGALLLLLGQPATILASAVKADKANKVDKADEDTSVKEKGKYHKGHILVKFVPGVEEEIEKGKKTRIHNKHNRKMSKGKGRYVELEEGESVDDLLKKFKTEYSDMILYAQPDYECEMQGAQTGKSTTSTSSTPIIQDSYTQTSYPLKAPKFLWYLDAINIEKAWEMTRGNPSVVIAVLDTGAAYEDAKIEEYARFRCSKLSMDYKKAPGLGRLNLWVNSREKADNGLDDDGDGYVDDVNGFDFIDHDGHPNDDNGHGTTITNLMAYDLATEGNSIGIASQCSFMILKVLDNTGMGYSSSVAEAIYYAADHGVHVMNLSLAWPPDLDPGPIIRDAITYAANAGVIMVAGSGNNGLYGQICYPAAYDEVIAVGATLRDRTRAWYSNYGPKLEIMAPGGNSYLDQDKDGYADGIINETYLETFQYGCQFSRLANTSSFGYWFQQGTSLATALTTGVVGLMLSINPYLDLTGIRNVLAYSAKDLGPAGWDMEYGYGLINAGAAIERVLKDRQYLIPATLPDPATLLDTAATLLALPETTINTDTYTDQPCQHPDCLNDLEIETECDTYPNDEGTEVECP